MNKEQFLAMSLFAGLKYIDNNENVVELHSIDRGINLVNFGWGDAKNINEAMPILHPISDLTKEIEHNGEKFVPLEILCDRYGAKFDMPYINESSAGFIYGFSVKDVLNVKNMIDNRFWQIQKLIKWHFDIAGLIEKGEAIDINSLPENPYK